MVRVGVTGHTNIAPASVDLVYQALLTTIKEVCAHRTPHGVTCLAPGADQLFARAVLAAKGTYEVILPAPDYRDRGCAPAHVPEFDELMARAAAVRHTGFARSGRAAYAAANATMLGRSECLIAVWDGRPVGARGSTAEVVAAARRRGIPVSVVWPVGTRRG
jgi:hypothetical protein